MNLKKLALCFAAVSLTFGAVLAAVLIFWREEPFDTVGVSRVAEEARTVWPDVSRGSYALEYPFSISDPVGRVLYKSSADAPSSLTDAVNSRAVVYPVAGEKGVIGCVLVSAELERSLFELRIAAAALVFGAFLLTAVLGFSYFYYLDAKLLDPFRKMQMFARRIAMGDLDVPLEMDRGHLFGPFTEAFDIMRAQLKSAREKEYEADRSKKELVASLSHDIKTPVTAIELTGELLLVTENDPRRSEKLRTITEKAAQIDRLVTEMFNSTLAELGELSVSVTEESSALLYGIIKSADYMSRAKTGRLPECIVRMDKARVEQVAGNIIANSYKYAGTDISVSGRLSDDYLILEFHDCGPGAPEEELEKLTSKFYRGNNASGKDGSGLGLFISRCLMERMGGTLSCRNDGGFVVEVAVRLA